ncbi:hypothetical protein Z043_106871 [Scleropages formosus]|uniref:Uncharacterized protein n=1 Tax=Scleropages formosus TaxID=113540 RepID=A0A0P7UIB8_SCLFO|nr:hypothetical protein Z043_106871 [Scleropages formosus]
MCWRSFTRCLGIALIPLSVCCIVANVLLYFPNGETRYAKDNLLTRYVWFFSGIAGGGLVVSKLSSDSSSTSPEPSYAAGLAKNVQKSRMVFEGAVGQQAAEWLRTLICTLKDAG